VGRSYWSAKLLKPRCPVAGGKVLEKRTRAGLPVGVFLRFRTSRCLFSRDPVHRVHANRSGGFFSSNGGGGPGSVRIGGPRPDAFPVDLKSVRVSSVRAISPPVQARPSGEDRAAREGWDPPVGHAPARLERFHRALKSVVRRLDNTRDRTVFGVPKVRQ